VANTKRRTVINADASHLRQAKVLIASGRYRTLSDFVREAMDEKLARVQRELLADEVERYCAAGHAKEDVDLVAGQALDAPPRRPPRGRRRATQ